MKSIPTRSGIENQSPPSTDYRKWRKKTDGQQPRCPRSVTSQSASRISPIKVCIILYKRHCQKKTIIKCHDWLLVPLSCLDRTTLRAASTFVSSDDVFSGIDCNENDTILAPRTVVNIFMSNQLKFGRLSRGCGVRTEETMSSDHKRNAGKKTNLGFRFSTF